MGSFGVVKALKGALPTPLQSQLGLAGGVMGTGIAGPQAANLQNPITTGQVNSNYQDIQNQFQAQQQLLQALQAQNGLQNQSQVYGQLQDIAAGRGPNPAQAMLNQATGQNVANQAALMAGQRGAASNVGLLARQAAMQGANTQQQAVGQGATLQANQALNALGQAGTLANLQAQNQISQQNQNVLSQQAAQQNLLNAIGAQNQAQVGSQGSINSANAGLAGQQLKTQGDAFAGLEKSAGQAMGFAHGGSIGPQSAFGKHISGNKMACGGMPQDYRSGGPVKASNSSQKASISGDSYSNDKIPAWLSEHEIVLPRSITMSPNAVAKSAKFVDQELTKRKK